MCNIYISLVFSLVLYNFVSSVFLVIISETKHSCVWMCVFLCLYVLNISFVEYCDRYTRNVMYCFRLNQRDSEYFFLYFKKAVFFFKIEFYKFLSR